MSDNFLKCSIGVIVYNEVSNIRSLLNSLLDQKLEKVSISEIIVVSSACTDGTDNVVSEYAKKYDFIKLIQEPARNGKSAAINLFLKAAKEDLLIIESGDTIPQSDTIEKLIIPFTDPTIGMTGGRPSPVNKTDNFIGYSVHLLWNLHHRMALLSPKLGEMIAFRKVFSGIPAKSAVDEASIEALIHEKGLKLKYIPNAIIINKGPETLKEFISQRKRIAIGHLWLKNNQHYKVSSQSGSILLKITIAEIAENPAQIIKIFGTILIEFYSRFLGYWDYKYRKKNPFTWEIAKSTKKLD